MIFLISQKVTSISQSVNPEITRSQLSHPLVSLLNTITVICWSFGGVVGFIRVFFLRYHVFQYTRCISTFKLYSLQKKMRSLTRRLEKRD